MSTKKHIYVNPLGGVKEMEYNNVEKVRWGVVGKMHVIDYKNNNWD